MVTIKDIARILASQHGVKTEDAELFITQMVEVINDGLISDRQVKIKGFGTFKLQTVKERNSVSVSTGERVTISEHDKVTFTPDSMMKDLINKPFSQFETVIIEDESLVIEDEFNADEQEKETEESESENPALIATALQNPASTVNEVVEEEKEVEETVEEQIDNVSEEISDVVNEDNQDEITDETIEENADKSEVVENVEEEKQKDIEEEEEKEETKEEEEEGNDSKEDEEEEEDEKEEADDKDDDDENDVEEEDKEEDDDEEDDDDDDDEYDYDETERSPMFYGVVSGVICSLLFFAIGYYACLNGWFDGWLPAKEQKSIPTDTVKQNVVQEIAKDTTIVKDTDNTNITKETKETKEEDRAISMDEYNKDTRVRTGAWVITGTKTEVTVKEGQTIKSISKAYFGPDMECYVEVYNDKKTVKAGDIIKIPELKLKKKLKK